MPGYIDNIPYYRISDHINKYHSVPRNNEEQLERAVERQPVSVAVHANQQSFQLIYSDPDCGDDLDHGVLEDCQ